MEFRKVLALRGPNLWAYFPVIEAWVDLGQWEDCASNTIPGFNARLKAWLPGLVEHRCSEGVRGGFHSRLDDGTYPAHILEHVTLELQSQAGVASGFGRARRTSEKGVYRVVFKYKEETLGRECLEAARQLVLAALEGREFDVAATVEHLKEVAEQRLLGPSTEAIVQAARRRNIPFRRLNQYSLVQLGYGSRQRRIRAAETDATRAIAESIAQDKDLTRQLLLAAGVPAPKGYPVGSADEAWETAEWIGLPVVVKPRDGNQGRGVTTNLMSREAVADAYKAAREESDEVIVESFIPGHDYRLLVVNNKLVAAARRDPAHVIGDGLHNIRTLVDIENLDPRRAEHHAGVLSKIHIDEIALTLLREQGYTPESVPPPDVKVLIRRNANLSTGGTARDVTDEVHPEVAARAIEAAQTVGLDIAGIDVIATNVTMPLEEQGGAIVEVNAAPGLRMHMAPSDGQPRDVGAAIVDMLFPPGDNGRIPVAAVTGTNGKTTVVRMLAHILQGTGKMVGMTCTDGIYLNERRIEAGDCSGPASAGMVLMNPMVDYAVLETARGGILRAGLGFNECQVAIVTNIADGDHLGLSEINTVEDLARLKRGIVEVVGKDGWAVLNATDPLVAAMAERCGGRTLYFAIDGEQPLMAAHRAAGGATIFVRDGVIVLSHDGREEEMARLEDIPMTFNGRIHFEVENALAAIGAAWALGAPRDLIREQATGFSTNMHDTPGRFNIIDVRGATVIVDYGHNAHALRAIIEALDNFPQPKRTALYSMAGDRRDSDIVHIGELLGDSFDHVILYEACTVRGRPPGAIAELMRQGLEKGSRVAKVEAVNGHHTSMEFALDSVGPGEVLLLQADVIDETVDFVRDYLRRTSVLA